MSIPASHSARISQHVYDDPKDPVPFEKDAILTIEGRDYKILEISDKDPLTGYQGAIYQDQSTGELIVAHRGTETSLITPLVKDLGVDAQMVAARANAQTEHAEALTQKALEMQSNPEYFPQGVTGPLTVSHTGHSLGGYHAQDRAAAHGHGGSSFNAFGAAGIGNAPLGIVEGAPPFTSYVRATDTVPLSSRHYGDVVSFATPEDLAVMTRPGSRPGVEGPIGFLGNVGTDALGRHSIDSFVSGGVMSEANRNRFLDHQPVFEEHARAVHQSREWGTHTGDVLRPGAVAAGVSLAASAPSVVLTPSTAFNNAARVGLTATADAMTRLDAPDVPGFVSRAPADAARVGLVTAAGLNTASADITEGSARAVDNLNDLAKATGRGVQQTIAAAEARVADALEGVGGRQAGLWRGAGDLSGRLHDGLANASDAIGFDGVAKALRDKADDVREQGEALARRVEQNTETAGRFVDRSGDGLQRAARAATDAVSAPLQGLADHHRVSARESRDEAQGQRIAADAVPEMLHAGTAPNPDLRAAARENISELYRQNGQTISGTQLDRLSVAVVADARRSGLDRIDSVWFSQGKSGPDFSGNLIAYQGPAGGDFTRVSATSIVAGRETPVEDSIERTRAANERQEQLQLETTQMQARDQAMRESQGMSMRIGARSMDGPGDGAPAGGDGGGG